jgi:hypothetical protein
MQVFLPYPDIKKSAAVLDNKRLGNQCYRECVTLFRGKWPNHPASKMMRGYENFLARYALALVNEMDTREHPDGRKVWKPEVISRWREFWSNAINTTPATGDPPWLGHKGFHRAHRSNLLRKDNEHYSKYFNEPDDLEYVWPHESHC